MLLWLTAPADDPSSAGTVVLSWFCDGRLYALRFRKGVETQRLVGVSVDDDDYAQVSAGMGKCSNYAHDKAMMGGVAVPDPYELLADILALENWRAQVHKRSEETAKKRKAGSPVAGVDGMQGAPA